MSYSEWFEEQLKKCMEKTDTQEINKSVFECLERICSNGSQRPVDVSIDDCMELIKNYKLKCSIDGGKVKCEYCLGVVDGTGKYHEECHEIMSTATIGIDDTIRIIMDVTDNEYYSYDWVKQHYNTLKTGYTDDLNEIDRAADRTLFNKAIYTLSKLMVDNNYNELTEELVGDLVDDTFDFTRYYNQDVNYVHYFHSILDVLDYSEKLSHESVRKLYYNFHGHDHIYRLLSHNDVPDDIIENILNVHDDIIQNEAAALLASTKISPQQKRAVIEESKRVLNNIIADPSLERNSNFIENTIKYGNFNDDEIKKLYDSHNITIVATILDNELALSADVIDHIIDDVSKLTEKNSNMMIDVIGLIDRENITFKQVQQLIRNVTLIEKTPPYLRAFYNKAIDRGHINDVIEGLKTIQNNTHRIDLTQSLIEHTNDNFHNQIRFELYTSNSYDTRNLRIYVNTVEPLIKEYIALNGKSWSTISEYFLLSEKPNTDIIDKYYITYVRSRFDRLYGVIDKDNIQVTYSLLKTILNSDNAFALVPLLMHDLEPDKEMWSRVIGWFTGTEQQCKILESAVIDTFPDLSDREYLIRRVRSKCIRPINQ